MYNKNISLHFYKELFICTIIPSRGTVLPAPHGKGNKCELTRARKQNLNVLYQIRAF